MLTQTHVVDCSAGQPAAKVRLCTARPAGRKLGRTVEDYVMGTVGVIPSFPEIRGIQPGENDKNSCLATRSAVRAVGKVARSQVQGRTGVNAFDAAIDRLDSMAKLYSSLSRGSVAELGLRASSP
jgi:hypothetical protein